MANDTKHSESILRDALLRRTSQLENNEEYRSEKRHYQKIRQLGVLTNIVITAAGILALAFYFREYMYDRFSVRLTDLLVPLTVLITGIGALAFKYLEPSPIESEHSNSDAEIRQLRFSMERRIRELQSQIQGSRPTTELNEAEKQKVLERLLSKFESEALNDYLVALKESINRQIRAQSLEDRYLLTRTRLSQEVKALARRGNFNLVIGALVAISGLVVLGYTVSNTPLNPDGVVILSYYVPRTTLVVLIEVFAYFFLSLYKSSLAEIKYFQNELTNIESKHLAWELAQKTDDAQVKITVIDQLAKTERNSSVQLAKGVDETREQISTLSTLTEAVKALIQKK
jgi:hypothetical protein